jgi:hypothetical protein
MHGSSIGGFVAVALALAAVVKPEARMLSAKPQI